MPHVPDCAGRCQIEVKYADSGAESQVAGAGGIWRQTRVAKTLCRDTAKHHRRGSFFADPVWAINTYDVCLTRVCTALSTTLCVRCRSVQKVPYSTCVVYEPAHRYKWDERL